MLMRFGVALDLRGSFLRYLLLIAIKFGMSCGILGAKSPDVEAGWSVFRLLHLYCGMVLFIGEHQYGQCSVALARAKAQIKPKQFQRFDLYVLKEWPLKKVARVLGVSSTHVYMMKHRTAADLKKEMSRFSEKAFG